MEVFLSSPWVPPEWIRAHGLQPRGIWFAPELEFDGHTQSAGACGFANAVIHLASARTGAAFVISSHCDQLRRGYDLLAGQVGTDRLFLFNLPVTWQALTAQRLYRSELARLTYFLVSIGGQPPSAKHLQGWIETYSAARHRLLQAADHASARAYAEALARFFWDGEVALPQAADEAPGGVRVALVGGPLLPRQRRWLDLLEQTGAHIVVHGTEPGERNLWPPVEMANGVTDLDGLRDFLADAYFTHCAEMYQRPNTRLYEWLGDRLRTRRASGIILWHHVGCDLWRAEAQSMREAFGLPLLLLDADELESGAAGSSTRLEAFVEALR